MTELTAVASANENSSGLPSPYQLPCDQGIGRFKNEQAAEDASDNSKLANLPKLQNNSLENLSKDPPMNDPGKSYASAEAIEGVKDDAIISIQTPSKVGSKGGTEDSGQNHEKANLAELTEHIRR